MSGSPEKSADLRVGDSALEEQDPTAASRRTGLRWICLCVSLSVSLCGSGNASGSGVRTVRAARRPAPLRLSRGAALDAGALEDGGTCDGVGDGSSMRSVRVGAISTGAASLRSCSGLPRAQWRCPRWLPLPAGVAGGTSLARASGVVSFRRASLRAGVQVACQRRCRTRLSLSLVRDR